MMAEYMRLRQICLVAPQLEPVISDICAIMGLDVCYRDGNVAKYGLENALMPVDTILLEVVAPTEAGTAAAAATWRSSVVTIRMAAVNMPTHSACVQPTSSRTRPITACSCIRAIA